MTEYQIASTIENYVTSHRGVTGSPLRLEQIMDEVDTLRIRTINELDRANLFRAPYQGYVQKITITLPSDKKITLPRIFVKEDGTYSISYVGGTEFNTPFRVVSGSLHGSWIKYDKMLESFPTVIVEGQLLTFKNTGATTVALVGVFEDPSDLEDDYGYISGLDNLDGATPSEYPAPAGIIDAMIGKTVESYLRTMYRIPPQPNKQVDLPQTQQK